MKYKKALFTHIGGKNAALGQAIFEYFPQKRPDFYVEPFGGSFGVAVQSDLNPNEVMMVYNDLDYTLYAILKAISHDPDKTIRAIEDLLDAFEHEQATVDYFKCVLNMQDKWKEVWTGDIYPSEALWGDDIYLGAAAWLLKHMTKQGDCINHKDNERYVDARVCLYKELLSSKDTIRNMENVYATRQDAIGLLSLIHEKLGDKQLDVLIYIDAPYSHSGRRTTNQDLYKIDNSKDDKEIKELAEKLEQINRATSFKIIVSEYDNPIYNKILSAKNEWHKIAVMEVCKSSFFSIHGESKPIETEYIWRNFV